jgi:signal transduction histidine kinase/CheY-like chemotaxis protein
MDATTLEHRIYLKKIAFLYGELPKGVFATLFLGFLLVMVLKEAVPIERLAIWYGLTLFVSLLRVGSFFYFRSDENREASIQKHERFLFLGTFLSGLLWGVSSIYIFPQPDELKLIVLFVIAGLSAGATGVLSPIFKIYIAFVLVMIIPFIAVFTLETSAYSFFIAIALLFYLIVISSTALKINQNYDDALRLGFTNDGLVQALKEKADLAEQASKTKSMFLSTMSHEIRTPLNAILGYISLLRKKETDADKQKKLEIIDHSSHLLLGVIDDILDYSKIASGRLVLEHIACDLKKEMEQLVELFQPLCREKGIVLECEIDPKIPLCILTDVLRVNQILNNLLSNAVKFTPEGKKVRLKSSYKEPQITFEVIDEGIGIDEEHQKIIFESFQQADSSTTRKYGGSGLGLAISYQLSLLLNSELQVSSMPGEGSTFSFCIDADVCEKIKDEAPVPEVLFEGEKVLVAEDNKTNQMLIRLLLEDFNLAVEIVNDGEEAVESYHDGFSLVLMDINMPNMNGIEAMQAIKRQYHEAYIIALTANALREDRKEYLNLGFDDYLSKPIDVQALNEALVRVIRENRSDSQPKA